ncbi:MAG: PRC-barrel domain-containing protein [Syntrophomonas sp.]
MKKSQEIIGLPVFSIVDGRKIGQVKDLVINPEEGKVDFILVSNGSWYVGARVLPYKSVMGVGEHAVTTESENQLTNINETAYAGTLLERNIEIKGNRILTNRGNLIGVISEFEIEENTGKITRLQYKCAQDETKVEIVEADQVLTFGADVVVVRQNTNGSNESFSALNVKELNDNGSEASGAEFFKQKQRAFLIGKKVIQDIKDAAGEILIAEGTVVTEAILNLAEINGKFVELSQCAK